MKYDEYTQLGEVESHYGFVYVLKQRTEKKCVYEATKGGKTYGYEVFKTKVIPVYKSDPVRYAEKYPGHEEFGKRAWFCSTYDKALKRYEKLK